MLEGKANPNFGYNAATDQYQDLLEAGIIDPTKVQLLSGHPVFFLEVQHVHRYILCDKETAADEYQELPKAGLIPIPR